MIILSRFDWFQIYTAVPGISSKTKILDMVQGSIEIISIPGEKNYLTNFIQCNDNKNVWFDYNGRRDLLIFKSDDHIQNDIAKYFNDPKPINLKEKALHLKFCVKDKRKHKPVAMTLGYRYLKMHRYKRMDGIIKPVIKAIDSAIKKTIIDSYQ